MSEKPRMAANSWSRRQARDPFVKKANKAGYRSRSAWKLIELDDKDHLISAGDQIVDLGAAPGGWSQVAIQRSQPNGRVLAVDLRKIQPITGLHTIEGDFTDQDVRNKILKFVGSGQIDLVLSDMAPNISGVRDTDQARSVALARASFKFAVESLRLGGTFVVKLFQGSEAEIFRRELESFFQRCVVRKPGSSRADSAEFYLVARGMHNGE
ncbi:MAG: 23S rRNA methyltransferase [Acidiferrobacteraceae bacterium]|nr:23S rRNA methyltransferase [Acidiferrobacteraceae bacterium]